MKNESQGARQRRRFHTSVAYGLNLPCIPHVISKTKRTREQPIGRKPVQAATELYKREPSEHDYANIRRQGKLLRKNLEAHAPIG